MLFSVAVRVSHYLSCSSHKIFSDHILSLEDFFSDYLDNVLLFLVFYLLLVFHILVDLGVNIIVVEVDRAVLRPQAEVRCLWLARSSAHILLIVALRYGLLSLHLPFLLAHFLVKLLVVETFLDSAEESIVELANIFFLTYFNRLSKVICKRSENSRRIRVLLVALGHLAEKDFEVAHELPG